MKNKRGQIYNFLGTDLQLFGDRFTTFWGQIYNFFNVLGTDLQLFQCFVCKILNFYLSTIKKGQIYNFFSTV